MRTAPTMQALYALAQRPEGVTTADVAKRYGLSGGLVSNRLANMADTGRLRREPLGQDRRHRWRFVADPAVPWATAERRAKERIAAKIEESKQRIAHAMKHGKDGVIAAKSRTTTRTIDGRAVKVTIGPCSPDMRFHVAKPDRTFAALALGSYLPSESAVARAYR